MEFQWVNGFMSGLDEQMSQNRQSCVSFRCNGPRINTNDGVSPK